RITLCAETDTPERPDSHADPKQWEFGPDGNRRDPWQFQFHLPMADTETGEIAVFKTGSKGGTGAISRLLNAYLTNPQKGRPIVQLSTDKYRNKKTGGLTDFPVFDIVGYAPDTAPAPVPMKALTETPAPVATTDVDDEIPF